MLRVNSIRLDGCVDADDDDSLQDQSVRDNGAIEIAQALINGLNSLNSLELDGG